MEIEKTEESLPRQYEIDESIKTAKGKKKLKGEIVSKSGLSDKFADEILIEAEEAFDNCPVEEEMEVLILRNVHLVNTPTSFKRGQKVTLPKEIAEKLIKRKNARKIETT